MKFFLSILAFVMCCMNCVAQTYIEPVFDRTDVPNLHINKIEVTKDTTFVHCTYTAEAGSWARISKDTYLYNPETQEKFPILQSNDLPFSPQKREFPDSGIYQVSFSFSSIGDATKLDFIEDPDDEAFNIYGISLTNAFDISYTETELKRLSDMSLSFDSAGDTLRAIQYKEQEKMATAFIYGAKSEHLLMVVYDLCCMYEKYGFIQKAIEQRKKITDYVESLNDNIEKWQLLSSISCVLCLKNDYSKAMGYSTKAFELCKKNKEVEHLKYAASLHELSKIYYMLGDYEKAISLGTEASDVNKKVFGTKHPDYAMMLNNLSLYNSAVGNYNEAIRLGTEALQITLNIRGTENPDYATSLGNLAGYYSCLGNYDEAIRLCTEALEIRKNVLGTEHPDYAASLGALSLFYSYLGNFEEAIQMGTKALNIIKKTLGTEHPNYATLLNNIALYYAQLGRYTEALSSATEALEIKRQIVGAEHPEYATLLSNIATYYAYQCDYEEAIQMGTKALNIIKKTLGTEHPNYATLLNNIALYYAQLGRYTEALSLAKEALEIKRKILGAEHPEYATLLGNIALYYAQLGCYTEALSLAKEASEITKKVVGTDHPEYATLLGNIATYYSDLGNYGKSIELGMEASEITKKVVGTDHPDYATSLGNLAGYYSDLGNYGEAIRLATEALEITKKIHGTEHLNYSWLLGHIAGYYSDLGDYGEAIRLGTEALEIKKRVLGSEHPDYAKTLGNLAIYYSQIGNYEESIRLGAEALEIKKKVVGTEHPDYATTLNNLAGCYLNLGNYGEAIRLGTEALKIRKKVLGSEHPDYAHSLDALAVYYSAMGNHVDAIQLGTEALEIEEKVLGTNHPDYATALGNLAVDYSRLGNYGEAIRLATRALEIKRKMLGLGHPSYAWLLSNLATDYAYLGNNKEAIRLEKEALEIRKKGVGTEHFEYALSLGNLAGYNSNIGNNGEAIRLSKEALNIKKKVLGTNNPYYAAALSSLAGYYSHFGNYGEAIRLETEALEIIKVILGTEHPDYALSLRNLALYHSYIGNYTEAYLYFKQSIESFQTYILKNLTAQSSLLKETFWRKNEYIYTKVLPSYVYKYKNAESIAELYDNTCLFAKGLLLNSDIELRKLILECGDSILIDKYNTISTNINIYNKLIEKPINERFMNADSLSNVIQKQEMELAQGSKIYGDYTHNLTRSWEDVRNHLSTNDIAIEFIDFPILKTDSMIYVALTLKKDYDSPHMVTLFEKKQLMAIPDSAYYKQTDTYDLIWKPLEKELDNVKSIYFAPSGELHRIGIEYVPASQTENISDKYSLHRLSSTRQLALIQDGTKGERSILYGGINYDENTNVALDASTSSVGGVRGIDVTFRSNVDSLLLRSSYEYLEGTKREVDQIADQMKQHQIHYQYYSGSDGSEESFKKLDGTKPKVMHIATHGFYLTEEEAKQSNFAHPHMELMMGDNQRAGRLIEDKPMTRSGLLFSGCNHAIRHEQIPEGVEDGILTAQEISTLDLRGLDLVVLSACQTALGDIASGEGVFGLQRGFKKAGAKTIVMSLWKVDDEATRILMVELYKNLMSGKSKQQSLKDAQKYLREYDNGKYDKPEYWASFIMLDGLK